MKKPTKDNIILQTLVENLMKDKKPFWRKVAKELSRPRRKRVEVNLSKIDLYAPDETTVLVPGKVLGTGNLSKKITISAFAFSEKAKQLITAAGGKVVTIENLYKSNPEGRQVMILK